MKQIVGISLLLAASVAFSCSKELETPAPQNQEKQVTMTVNIPGDLTKVSFTQDADADGAVKLAWQGTDKIRVIDHDDATDNQQFSIQNGYTDHSASFSGTEVTATSYDILYPGTLESVAAAKAVQYGVQTQTDNASTAHLSYMALLSGVNTYENVDFSETWAAAHGGTFKQSGVLRLRIQLPDDIKTSKIASLTVNAPSALFYKTNACIAGEKVSSVKLNFSGEGATPADGVVTGYIMLAWEDVTLAANTQLSVIVETAAHAFFTKNFTPSTTQAKTFATGRVNAVKLNKNSFGAATTTFAGGSGTENDPWLIANATHMGNIAKNLSTSEKKYFKLIDNITLTSWTSLNPDDNKSIDLNGNGKTISGLNKPLFDFLDGKVSYLNITNATINKSGSNYYGVLVRTISKENCVISNISVSNSSVSGAGYIGGLIGRITATTSCEVTDCYADVTVSGTEYYSGGLVGYTVKGSFTRCYASGNVSNTKTNYCHAGGLLGGIVGGSVESCHASGNITVSGAHGGGLIGTINGNVTVSCSYAIGDVTNDAQNINRLGGLIGAIDSGTSTISNCYSTGAIKSKSYSGGLVGNIANSVNLTVTNCYSTSDLSNIKNAGKGAFCGGTNTSTISCTGFINVSSNQLYYGTTNPFNGHESDNYSGTDGTILSHAKTFGWNFTTIWKEINPPTLK